MKQAGTHRYEREEGLGTVRKLPDAPARGKNPLQAVKQAREAERILTLPGSRNLPDDEYARLNELAKGLAKAERDAKQYVARQAEMKKMTAPEREELARRQIRGNLQLAGTAYSPQEIKFRSPDGRTVTPLDELVVDDARVVHHMGYPGQRLPSDLRLRVDYYALAKDIDTTSAHYRGGGWKDVAKEAGLNDATIDRLAREDANAPGRR